MIQHCAMFRFRDDVAEDDIAAFEAALAELPAAIPEIRAYAFGRDLAIEDGNADFAVIATFDDDAGYRTYSDHPVHVEVKQTVGPRVIASRSAVQIRA